MIYTITQQADGFFHLFYLNYQNTHTYYFKARSFKIVQSCFTVLHPHAQFFTPREYYNMWRCFFHERRMQAYFGKYRTV